MKIIRKKDDHILFSQAWSDYLGKEITGMNYSLDVIRYYLATNASSLVCDESFVLMGEAHDSVCLGICFLPIYSDETGNYSEATAPLASKKKYLKICFDYIDDIARSLKLEKIEFLIDVFYSQYGRWKYNFLRDYGYIDCTVNNYIFKLDDSSKALFQKFNTSSRNILRKTLKNNHCKVFVYDDTNINMDAFLNYKKYHAICSGRQTRSDESFSYMFELIEARKAILLELNYEEKPVGYLLVFLFYPYSALSSIANLPEYERIIPIYRMLYWKAIEYCADYKMMAYGFPAGNSLIDGFKSYMDESQLLISKYKGYMGGICVANYKGVKYFNLDLMKRDVEDFLLKLSELHYDNRQR